MCAQVFIEAGADPTVMSGAQMTLMRGAYRIGEGEDFIFEACEYMDSFLDFNPNIAVILNVELDHVDYFRDLEQVISSYSEFADIAGKDGCAVFNADDENVISSLENFDGTRISFSIKDRGATFFADNISFDRTRPHFDIMKNGQRFCSVKLAVYGEHNVYNALACAAAADACGISAENIAKGLSHFCGAQRRLEYKGSFMGADVFDDYAHHPSEVKATLDCVADMGYDRVVCVFQSHTYSRTAALIDEFSHSFESADVVMVADIYPARETDTLGMSAEALAQAIGENAVAVGSFEKIANELKHTLRNGDLLVVMGAGDIYKVFDYLEI
jgi:UDP-N-acetylmuramate--alanine ligase